MRQMIMYTNSRRMLMLGVSSLIMLGGNAYAQETVTDEVIVTGIRGSLQRGLEVKRSETRIVEAFSAEDIAELPDENLAESIQRLSGVQISRIDGRGAQISIRGLGPAFAKTTVNGQNFLPADFREGFRFDILQSEVASGVQVFKSPSAEQDEGGLSGVIDVTTTRPLDHNKRTLVAAVQGAYTDANDKIAPRGNITYVDQFADDKVGVFLNLGLQELKTRDDILFIDRYSPVDLDGDSVNDVSADGTIPAERPNRIRTRRTDTDTTRYLASGALQYQPTENLDFNLNGIWSRDDRFSDQPQLNNILGSGVVTILGSTGLTADRLAVTGNRLVTNHQETEIDLSSQAYTADATWKNEIWKAKGIVHYTRGESRSDERAAIIGIEGAGGVNVDIDFSNFDNPIVDIDRDVTDPSLFVGGNVFRANFPRGAIRRSFAEEWAFQSDVERFTENLGIISSVQAGVKYRTQNLDRSVVRRDDSPAFIATLTPNRVQLDLTDASFVVTDFLAGAALSLVDSFIVADLNAYEANLDAQGIVIPLDDHPAETFNVSRDIFAAYAQVNFEEGPVRGNVGARYVHTNRDVQSFSTQEGTGTFTSEPLGSTNSQISYDKILPSANVIMDVTDEIIFRIAAAEVLVRPTIGDVQFSQVVTASDNGDETTAFTVERGDPEQTPLTATQFDASLEWYFTDASAFSVGYFHKNVRNRTTSSMVCPADFDIANVGFVNGVCMDADGNDYTITQNVTTAESVRLNGLEVSLTTSLDALLPVDGFGLYGNYTFITSDAPFDAPLLDTSRHTWNLIAYYENDKFSTRVAWNFRSEFDVNDFFRPIGAVLSRNQIDVSASYKLTDDLKINVEALNLNNDQEQSYRFERNRFQSIQNFGRTINFGVAYKF